LPTFIGSGSSTGTASTLFARKAAHQQWHMAGVRAGNNQSVLTLQQQQRMQTVTVNNVAAALVGAAGHDPPAGVED
jgi:hypothetical protein